MSALPYIEFANCCCLWLISGGIVTAYLMQQGQSQPLEVGEGAVGGALAGVVGAFVYAVVSLPIQLFLAPLQPDVADLTPAIRRPAPGSVRHGRTDGHQPAAPGDARICRDARGRHHLRRRRRRPRHPVLPKASPAGAADLRRHRSSTPWAVGRPPSDGACGLQTGLAAVNPAARRSSVARMEFRARTARPRRHGVGRRGSRECRRRRGRQVIQSTIRARTARPRRYGVGRRGPPARVPAAGFGAVGPV